MPARVAIGSYRFVDNFVNGVEVYAWTENLWGSCRPIGKISQILPATECYFGFDYYCEENAGDEPSEWTITTHRTADDPAPPVDELPFDDGLAFWLRADVGFEQENGITRWTDQASGLTLKSTPNASNDPQLTSYAATEREVVQFDGDGDILCSDVTTRLFSAATGGLTVFVVANSQDPTSEAVLLNHAVPQGGADAGNFELGMALGAGGFGAYGLSEGSANATQTPAGVVTAGAEPVIFTTQVQEIGGSPGNVRHFLDRSPLSVADSGTGFLDAGAYPTEFATIEIGGRRRVGTEDTEAFLNGGVAEVLIYDRVLDATEREAVWAYLEGRYYMVSLDVPEGAAYWKAEGHAGDETGRHDGMLQGGVAFAAGRQGQAFSFDGSGCVSVPHAATLNLEKQMSVAAWVKIDSSASGVLTILAKSGAYAFSLDGTTGAVSLALEGIGPVTGGTVPADKWTHVAATYYGRKEGSGWSLEYRWTAELWIDGVRVKQTSSTVLELDLLEIRDTTSALQIGMNDGSHGFKGLIDEVRLHYGKLPGSDIQKLASQEFQGTSGGNWSDPGNWGTAPAADDHVSVSVDTIVDGLFTGVVKALNVLGGATTVDTNLTVTNDLVIKEDATVNISAGKDLIVEGNLSTLGGAIVGAGKLVLKGITGGLDGWLSDGPLDDQVGSPDGPLEPGDPNETILEGGVIETAVVVDLPTSDHVLRILNATVMDSLEVVRGTVRPEDDLTILGSFVMDPVNARFDRSGQNAGTAESPVWRSVTIDPPPDTTARLQIPAAPGASFPDRNCFGKLVIGQSPALVVLDSDTTAAEVVINATDELRLNGYALTVEDSLEVHGELDAITIDGSGSTQSAVTVGGSLVVSETGTVVSDPAGGAGRLWLVLENETAASSFSMSVSTLTGTLDASVADVLADDVLRSGFQVRGSAGTSLDLGGVTLSTTGVADVGVDVSAASLNVQGYLIARQNLTVTGSTQVGLFGTTDGLSVGVLELLDDDAAGLTYDFQGLVSLVAGPGAGADPDGGVFRYEHQSTALGESTITFAQGIVADRCSRLEILQQQGLDTPGVVTVRFGVGTVSRWGAAEDDPGDQITLASIQGTSGAPIMLESAAEGADPEDWILRVTRANFDVGNPTLLNLIVYDSNAAPEETTQRDVQLGGSASELVRTLGWVRTAVGEWRAEGNADDSAGWHHGQLQGAATFAAGEVGQAFSFDGSSGYVQIPHDDALNMTGAITMTAWVKPNNVTTRQAVLSKGGNSAYAMYVDTGGAVRVELAGVGTYLTAPAAVTAGVWNHLSAVYTSGDSVRVYVDSTEVLSTPASGDIGDNQLALEIGRAQGSAYFDGLIDEVRLDSYELSGGEVFVLMDEPLNPIPEPAGRLLLALSLLLAGAWYARRRGRRRAPVARAAR
ncbi:LamG domain-containing protein [Planctomycetota bacterium]